MSEDMSPIKARLEEELRTERQTGAIGGSLDRGPVAAAATDEAIQRKALEILRREMPGGNEVESRGLSVESEKAGVQQEQTEQNREAKEQEPLPARMLNEFVYCPRLFYYEHVEGVFVDNADTLRGTALHKRVDTGKGKLPNADRKIKARRESRPAESGPAEKDEKEETIHARSVFLGSERLGVNAKIDMVEVRVGTEPEGELFGLEVCPVDYKAGSPKEGPDANELWDADKMQLGLQALILRDNGYTCKEGIIYYRGTKQRVPLPITKELEDWIIGKIAEARHTAEGPMPPPLVNSPKCPRCSLVTVCLPDETRLLTQQERTERTEDKSEEPRRLIAARADKRALYLTTQGLRVGRKEEVLQIKDRDMTVDEVRFNDVSHLALFGNIQVSTQAIQGLCEVEVPITYFSLGGWFYGITRGHELKNVFLRMEQFRTSRDKSVCLPLARQFVHGKIRNHRTMLMRNHLEPPAATLAKLKHLADSALNAKSMDELLGTEGSAANFYFQQFGGMVKIADELADDRKNLEGDAGAEAKAGQLFFNFSFMARNRRPPTDPVNALLSLAYSLLAKDCTVAALAVGFDPYVGFYHQPRFGRPALALDLMEEFRPLVAESTVLSSINNRVITATDFVKAGKSVNLTSAGRKRFFQMYEQRMTTLLTHPLFDYKVSYRRALELQARILAKALTGEIAEYTPLMTR